MQTDAPKPTLVLMAGLPGAGKSTLALALGKELGWPVIDKDTVKTALMQEAVPESVAGPASYYLPLALSWDLVVEQRLCVILDSPAAYPSVVERAQQVAQAAGGQLKVIFCQAGSHLRNQRLALRSGRLSQMSADPTPDELSRYRFDHLPVRRLDLQMQRPMAVLVAEAVAYLRAMEAGPAQSAV